MRTIFSGRPSGSVSFEDLVGGVDAALVLGADGTLGGFLLGHLGQKHRVLVHEAAVLIGMGGEGARPNQRAVLHLVDGALADVVVFQHRLGNPDDLVQVPDALVLVLDFFLGVLGVALDHLGVLNGDHDALAIELAVAAFGHHVGVHHVENVKVDGHVRAGATGQLLGRLHLVVVGVVAPAHVHSQRVALVVDHDIGAVVADGHAPVVELGEADEGAELLIPVVSGGVALTLGIGVGHIHTRIGQHLLAGLKGGLAAAVHMNVHVTQQILHHLDEHLTTLVAVLTGAIVGKPVDEHVGLRFELSRESELLNFHLLLLSSCPRSCERPSCSLLTVSKANYSDLPAQSQWIFLQCVSFFTRCKDFR